MANKLPKYEQLYRMGRFVCGAPAPQFVDFFDTLDRPACRVLDLGCGQGRDALFIARKGHEVLGVDVAPTGVRQMLEDAAAEGLRVAGVVADVVTFVPDGAFAVILLDRVLHMLDGDDDRVAVLEMACRHTEPGGYLLIAETPRSKGLLDDFFAGRIAAWEKRLDAQGYLILRRTGV